MTLPCPRRNEAPYMITAPSNDNFNSGRCSYCGSAEPGVLLDRLNKSEVVITPTDKNYKIYMNSKDGEEVERKFYFQHFNDEQKRQFVNLLNEKKIEFAEPGYFYVKPFFVE